ncbi:carboxypeptidase-like regulatory domain-containing protein [Streptomyces sp. ActVer]|uniref:carboxypeptidase-like regulatory domain-containing protein n=1 Tax=Streptomyces sp. ActVer TaxID=3014558 RepID=UPI0022B33A01|nr:carboxypeptidase-like regulatory domain-containing protein [Streptomyces sp. ActVer]MCZ4507727.1 carboxypeptidase-like regulatory domain-containing protein [Streptomyces sp. ActVer]
MAICPQPRATASAHLTGREFFPHLISQPFHDGLVIVFSLAIAMALAAAAASLIRGRTKPLPTSPTPMTPAAMASPAAIEAGSATPPALELRGRVRDSAGKPLVHATLTLVDRYGHQKAIARSGQDGAYELASAEPGSHMLVVSAKGHEPRAVQVTTGAEPALSDLTLTAICGVHGTVRHAHTDRPVPHAHITLLNTHGDVVTTSTTSENGTYTLRGLTPGPYTVVASGSSPVAADVTLGNGETRQVDLQTSDAPD